jgi:hypothetical protein
MRVTVGMSTRTLLKALIATGALALVAPGVAGAENICVYAPPGVTCNDHQPDLQAALDAAQTNPGADRVLLGDPGFPQNGPFVYPGAPVLIVDPVVVDAVGATRPVLTGPAGSNVISGNKLSLNGIDVHLPSTGGGRGIGVTGGATLHDVRVTGPGPQAQPALGIQAFGAISLDDVDVSGTGAIGLDLVYTGLAYSVNATRLHVADVSQGLVVGDATTLQVTKSKIAARDAALTSSATASISTSVLETSAPDAIGVNAGDGNVALDHVTVVHRGTGNGNDAALNFHPVNVGGQADLSSVVLAGYSHGILHDPSEGPFNFPMTIRDSVWDNSHDVFVPYPNTGTIDETGNSHVDPKLVDPANGDFRLRGSSAAIDRDTQTDPAYVDLNAGALVDGDANGSQLADAGALEYRRVAPSIDSADVPASGTTGQALAFSATASDADGDHVQLAWEFGDGDVGAGDQATHTYAAPGIYTVTLHARDEAGVGAARTFSVAVSGAAVTTGSSGAINGAAAIDTVVPRLSNVRLSRSLLSRSRLRARTARLPVLRFTVSELATVRITVGGAKIVKRVSAGRDSIGLAKALRQAKHLRIGRVAVKVQATDAAGNRSTARSAVLKVVA